MILRLLTQQIGLQIAALTLQLVSYPILQRHFGVAELGVILLFQALLGASANMDFGIAKTMTLVVASTAPELRSKSGRRILFTGIWSLLMWAGIGVVVGSFVVNVPMVKDALRFGGVPEPIAHSAAIGASSVLLATAVRGFNEGTGRMRFAIAWRYAVFLLGSVTTLIGAISGLNASDTIRAQVVVVAASSVSFFVWTILLEPPSDRSSTIRDITQFCRLSVGQGFYGFVVPFVSYSDRFLVSSLYGPEVSAPYLLISDFMDRVRFIPGAIVNAIGPRLIQVQVVKDAGRSSEEFVQGLYGALDIASAVAFGALLATCGPLQRFLFFGIPADVFYLSLCAATSGLAFQFRNYGTVTQLFAGWQISKVTMVYCGSIVFCAGAVALVLPLNSISCLLAAVAIRNMVEYVVFSKFISGQSALSAPPRVSVVSVLCSAYVAAVAVLGDLFGVGFAAIEMAWGSCLAMVAVNLLWTVHSRRRRVWSFLCSRYNLLPSA